MDKSPFEWMEMFKNLPAPAKDLLAGTHQLNAGTQKKLRLRQRTKARFRKKHRLYEESIAAIEEHRKRYPRIPAPQIIENWRQAYERDLRRCDQAIATLQRAIEKPTLPPPPARKPSIESKIQWIKQMLREKGAH